MYLQNIIDFQSSDEEQNNAGLIHYEVDDKTLFVDLNTRFLYFWYFHP